MLYTVVYAHARMRALVHMHVGGRAQREKNTQFGTTDKQCLIRCAALMYKFRYLS
jgi:hypothetical protein